jgi:hypothetical protein
MFEHRSGKGAAAPVFIYAKMWLPLYHRYLRETRRTTKSRDQELREKYQARNERLNFLERRKQLVDIEKFRNEHFYPFCDELNRSIEIVGRVSPEAQRILVEGLQQAKARLGLNGAHATNGNGHRRRRAEDAGVAKDPADAL